MVKHEKLDRNNVNNIMELTPMQESMLLQYIKDPESMKYFEQTCYTLHGEVNIDIFNGTWKVLSDANEMLRTIFRWEGLSKPLQIVLKNHKIPVYEYDLTNLVHEDKDQIIEKIMIADRDRKIDIGLQPFRITLCKVRLDHFYMIISHHHIISDGWSNALLLKEFVEVYDALYTGKTTVCEKKNNYSEFVKWHREQDKNKQKMYWEKYLRDYRSTQNMFGSKYKRAKEELESYYYYRIDDNLTKQIRSFTKQNEITLAELIYTSWSILINKYYNIEDLIFGTTVSGRIPDIVGVESMVGLFINTLLMRVCISDDKCIVDLLSDVKKMVIERHDVEGTSIIDAIAYGNLCHKDNIINSVVVVQNYPLDQVLLDNSKILSVKLNTRFYMTGMPLTLGVRDFEDIILDFTYNTGLFSKEEISNMAIDFIEIIRQIVDKSNTSLQQIYVQDIKLHSFSQNNLFLSEININIKEISELEKVDFDEVF